MRQWFFILNGKWYDNLFYQSISEIGIYIIIIYDNNFVSTKLQVGTCYIVGARHGQWRYR